MSYYTTYPGDLSNSEPNEGRKQKSKRRGAQELFASQDSKEGKFNADEFKRAELV
jgi:hypothetical protein